jgi:hypothetical protein
MAFTGFNIELPTYEVITPHTNKSYKVRGMTVQEEEKLKGSLNTPLKITDHLNKTIYKLIVDKPEGIENYNDFLKNTTLRDRDALLFGIYHTTYEEIRNYEIVCSNCENKFPVTINASDTFNINMYPGDDILSHNKIIDMKVAKGVRAVIKQPTLYDEMQSINQLSSRPGINMDIISEILIIDKFIQEVVDSKKNIEYIDKSEIIDAYLSLPARDKRIIYNEYKDEYGDYGIELKMKTFCPKCGNEDDSNIDLVENFFRSIYSA